MPSEPAFTPYLISYFSKDLRPAPVEAQFPYPLINQPPLTFQRSDHGHRILPTRYHQRVAVPSRSCKPLQAG